MNLKVIRLNTSSYHKSNFKLLEKKRIESLSQVQMTDKIDEPQIVISTSYSNIEKLLPYKNQIKFIIHPNSGYDNYSYDLTKKLNVPIILGNEIRAQAVAQYVLSALMKTYNPIPIQEKWDRQFDRRPLWQSKALIIGQGHVGKILGQSLKGIVKELHFNDPYKGVRCDISLSSFDIIILACGLNSSSKHLVDKNFLDQCSSSVFLINPARGGLIKTDDLFKFLADNQQANAQLDCFEKEPFDLCLLPQNAKGTSHIAGVYDGLDDAIIDFEYSVIKSFLDANLDYYQDQRLDTFSKEHFLA